MSVIEFVHGDCDLIWIISDLSDGVNNAAVILVIFVSGEYKETIRNFLHNSIIHKKAP